MEYTSLIRVQQTYRRRKADADCYVGEKFHDPAPTEEPCACGDEDYEWCAGASAAVVFLTNA